MGSNDAEKGSAFSFPTMSHRLGLERGGGIKDRRRIREVRGLRIEGGLKRRKGEAKALSICLFL